MVKVAALYSAGFAKLAGGASALIPQMAAGEVDPRPAVLRHFGLEVDGKSYVWTPR